jgi:hypothetical protein
VDLIDSHVILVHGAALRIFTGIQLVNVPWNHGVEIQAGFIFGSVKRGPLGIPLNPAISLP